MMAEGVVERGGGGGGRGRRSSGIWTSTLGRESC